MIKEQKAITTIELSNNKLTIIAKSGDELPTAAYQMNKTAIKYSMKRPTSKRETMAMCGKNL